MTRYRVTDITTQAVIFIEATPPFDLSAFRPPGTYVLAALSADSPQVTILPNQLPSTVVPLELTASINQITILLDTINAPAPPDPASWTYAEIGAIPGGGATSLVGASFSIFPSGGAGSRDYVVRRTYTGGTFEDIIFRVTIVQALLTVVDDVPDLNLGADDDDDTTITLTVTTDPPGGPYDGVPVGFTRGAINAAVAADTVVFGGTPLIGFQTDADSDGQLDVGDVARIIRGPIWTPAERAVSSEWEIDQVLTGNSAATFTRGAGVTGNTLTRRWWNGSTIIRSNPIPLAQAAQGTPATYVTVAHYYGGGGATSHSANLNFGSSTQAGDTLVVVGVAWDSATSNVSCYPASITVGGQQVVTGSNVLFTDSSLTGAVRRPRAWAYTLTAPLTSSTPVVLSNYNGTNVSAANVSFGFFVIRGGQYVGRGIVTGGGATTTILYTPQQNNSLILLMRSSGADNVGNPGQETWSGATGRLFGNNRLLFATRADAPAGQQASISVTTPTASGQGYLAALEFAPA